MIPITADQLKRLQVLYTQYERHSLDCPGASRADRIAWASQQLGRPIASFRDLELVEAKRLIDSLQAQLGTRFPAKPRKLSRKAGQKAGTEGRRDQIHAETTLVSPGDFARIQREMRRLGWDEKRLQAFIQSPRSPLNHHPTAIRTLGEANRVYWALKRMKANPVQETAAI